MSPEQEIVDLKSRVTSLEQKLELFMTLKSHGLTIDNFTLSKDKLKDFSHLRIVKNDSEK